MSENISKKKRELLIQRIDEIKAFISACPQDEQTSRLDGYLTELAAELNGKRYGLVFEEHRERIDEILSEALPVLDELRDLRVNGGERTNSIIEGDNLAALDILTRTHGGRIDIIYIDPPYNTGKNDFVYDDKFVCDDDLFSHSKWLSFMNKRLVFARKLLAETGVIFISIDDNEQAALKLLCDRVFGAENFLACVCVKGNPRGRQSSAYFAKVHDFLLVYRKSAAAELQGFDIDAEQKKKRFNKTDEGGESYEEWELRKRGADSRREDSPNLWFPIYYDEDTGEISTVRTRLTDIEITPKLSDGTDGRWRWSREKVECEKSKLYVRKTKSGGYNVYERKYIEEKPRQKAPTIWDYPEVNTELGTKLLKSVLGEKAFDFPKPIGLLTRILSMVKKDATVLDFFAGSGTTGHAVMSMNAADGGSRRFILCTNNQNNICREVTYERLKRVILSDNYRESIRYYKIDFVDTKDKLYYEYADELLRRIIPLIELENGEIGETAVAFTEDELDEAVKGGCGTVYLGHDVLPSEYAETEISARGIIVNVIPDYYYGAEKR